MRVITGGLTPATLALMCHLAVGNPQKFLENCYFLKKQNSVYYAAVEQRIVKTNQIMSKDAHFFCRIGVLLSLLLPAMGANYETTNFIVNAPTADSAQQFAETAEQCRKELAILWLGKTLPNWSAKCPVKIHVGDHLGAGGKTSFIFENGEVFDWDMEIQGPYERILDSVLPHEITHMILASHFRKPIPRWLDEGMATTVEHKSEKANYRRMLRHFLQSNVQRCFPLNRLVAIKEYPVDPMPLYAQGFSLVEFLLESGRQFDDYEHCRLVRFTQSAIQHGDWQSALQEHYDIQNLGVLQLNWVAWVGNDIPALPMGTEVAGTDREPEYRHNVPVVLVSARPPSGKSVYDRHTKTISTQWNDEKPVSIPTSFGQGAVVR